MIVGCGVYLNRDLKKRSRCTKIGDTTMLDEKGHLSSYKRFACADTKETAWKALEDIEDVDSA